MAALVHKLQDISKVRVMHGLLPFREHSLCNAPLQLACHQQDMPLLASPS